MSDFVPEGHMSYTVQAHLLYKRHWKDSEEQKGSFSVGKMRRRNTLDRLTYGELSFNYKILINVIWKV